MSDTVNCYCCGSAVPKDTVFLPDFVTCVKQLAAHLDQQGKTYIEIAVDPKTKEIAHSFTPTPPTYSAEQPTREGWYWCINDSPESPTGKWEGVVLVEETAIGLTCSFMTAPGKADVLVKKGWAPTARWFGPLTPPKQA